MKRNKTTLLLLVGIIIGVAACADNSGDEPAEADEKISNSDGKSVSHDSRMDDSRLTLFMRQTEDHMKVAREDVLAGRKLTDTLDLGFAPVGYYEASPHVHQNEEAYKAYTQNLLEMITAFSLADSSDRIREYNLVVGSCISCHESYCPGPIQRIKKLKIKR